MPYRRVLRMSVEDQKCAVPNADNCHRCIDAINHGEYQATLFSIATDSLASDERGMSARIKQSLRPLVLLLPSEYHLKA